MFPSFANSSGRALAQKPLWETKSGHAYFGRVSGLILDGSLEVNPSRRAPLQQHCFLVICKGNSSNNSVWHLNIYLHTTSSITSSTYSHHADEPTRFRKHFIHQTAVAFSAASSNTAHLGYNAHIKKKKNQIKSMWRGETYNYSCMMTHLYF